MANLLRLFVDNALILYCSSKVQKFLLDFSYRYVSLFPNSTLVSCISLWLRFAVNRGVEELNLAFCKESGSFALHTDWDDLCERYLIPQFVYQCSTLTKLSSRFCDFVPKTQLCWGSLKVLTIGFAKLKEDVLRTILQGSPVLEYLELNKCQGFRRLDVGSSGLKKLVIRGIWDPTFIDVSVVEISGPNLESLELLGYWRRRKCQLLDISSLVDATVNFEMNVALEHDGVNASKGYRDMIERLLEKLNHVRQLTLGTWMIQVMSTMEVGHLPSLSNCKSLILDTLFSKWILPGIASLLHRSPNLERLVIDMTRVCSREFDLVSEFLTDLDEENYWSLGTKSCNCLLKHMKIVEIIIDLKKSNPAADILLLAFLQFVLQNAMVLERMVFTCKHDKHVRRGAYDPFELALKLLSFPRSSPRAVILLPKCSY